MPTEKITTMDRTSFRQVQAEAMKALQTVAEQFGLTVSPNCGMIDTTRGICTLKFDFLVRTETADGEVLDRKAIDFQTYAPQFDLETTDLHREFVFRGERYRVVGLTPRSFKFPVIAEKLSSGQTFKFPVETVKNHFVVSS